MVLRARPRAIRSHSRDGFCLAASSVLRWLDLYSRGHECASGFVGAQPLFGAPSGASSPSPCRTTTHRGLSAVAIIASRFEQTVALIPRRSWKIYYFGALGTSGNRHCRAHHVALYLADSSALRTCAAHRGDRGVRPFCDGAGRDLVFRHALRPERSP